MQYFVIKIIGMSIASSAIGLMILGIRKLNKKMPIQLISMFWLIFLAFLIIPFQFESIHNNMKITQPINEIKENVLAKIEVQGQATQSIDFWKIIFFVHLIVFVALCLKDLCAYIVLKYNIKNKKIELSPENLKLFDIAKKKLNFKRKADLICQDKVLTPATVGIFRPKILISKEFLSLSGKEQKCIFLHELMHIKKLDNVKYFLINITKNFYWFNPLINFLTRRLKEDIEILTDKLVVEYVEIKEYLMLILKISQLRASNGGAFPAFAADKKNLERRIKIVKREKKLSLAVISSFAALASMLIYTGVVFANPPKTTANNQPNSEASQADPNSGNSENNNSNSGNSGAKNKYVIKDFETGETLKLDQQGFDEYMKKWTDKGFISVEVDPSVQESMEKTWLEDASSKPKTGCYAKEAK